MTFSLVSVHACKSTFNCSESVVVNNTLFPCDGHITLSMHHRCLPACDVNTHSEKQHSVVNRYESVYACLCVYGMVGGLGSGL